MHLFKWLNICLALVLLAACSANQKEMEKRLAGESFFGVVPCADCDGIAYDISFYANSRYESSSMYIGKSNEKFIEQGSWSANNDSIIVLRNEEEEERSMQLNGSRLKMLDLEGNEIEGPLASRYVLHNSRTHPVEGKLLAGELAESPVDFKAHGNEPFWGLQIDMDGLLSFKVVSGDSLGGAVRSVSTDSASGTQTVTANLDEGTLRVELHPVGCMDGMSGQVYDYRVLVRRNGAEYTGCGGFIER